jgi:DNA polymerase elongation subunit (family B)
VANRYFGAYGDGTLKARGIEARRRDTPPFIKQTQLEMLEILAEGRDAAGFRARLPEAVAHAQAKLQLLRAGDVPLDQLVMRQRLSRKPEEFVVRTVAAHVARELVQGGVDLAPGEPLRFVLIPGPEKARAWELIEGDVPYDRQAYTELMLRAVGSVLAAVDVDRQMVDRWLLGNAGYWGPPGTLPPRHVDGRLPLLAWKGPVVPRTHCYRIQLPQESPAPFSQDRLLPAAA